MDLNQRIELVVEILENCVIENELLGRYLVIGTEDDERERMVHCTIREVEVSLLQGAWTCPIKRTDSLSRYLAELGALSAGA